MNDTIIVVAIGVVVAIVSYFLSSLLARRAIRDERERAHEETKKVIAEAENEAKLANGYETIFLPVGGGGKRDYEFFRNFLGDMDYAQRGLVFCTRERDGLKNVYMIEDENDKRVYVRDMNGANALSMAYFLGSVLACHLGGDRICMGSNPSAALIENGIGFGQRDTDPVF